MAQLPAIFISIGVSAAFFGLVLWKFKKYCVP